jgi:hypothetical protein
MSIRPSQYHSYELLVAVVISAILGLPVTTSYLQSANAECIRDEDWPEKPCLDSGTYSEAQLKQIWDKYYEMKGKEWMEMKKAEMDQAIRNGTFGQWINYAPGNNFANSNVYTYYRLNNQVPNMVLDPKSGEYVVSSPESLAAPWYASTTGIYTMIGGGIVGAAVAFYTLWKVKRK